MTVLLSDVEDAQRLAAALDDARRPDSPLAVIAVPPVRGLAFFADADRQAKLDLWWANAIPQGIVPVYLLMHESGVADWLPGLDGRFIVAVSDVADAVSYQELDNVTVAGGPSLLDLALATIAHFEASPMFRVDAAARLQKRLWEPLSGGVSRFRRARLRPADEPVVVATAAPDEPIPNLPPADSAVRLREDARREEVVRALADTLRRLQRIRTGR